MSTIAVAPPAAITAENLARWRRAQGVNVREIDGSWWQRNRRVPFWTPLAAAHPLPFARIIDPAPRSFGYLAQVEEPHLANRSMSFTAVEDVSNFSTAALGRKRRWSIRQALNSCEFRLIDDPEILARQGFPLAQEAAARTGRPFTDDAAAFRRWGRLLYEDGPGWVLGSFAEGRLVAYLSAYVTRDFGYFENVTIGDSGLHCSAGYGLYALTLESLSSVPGIRDVHLGPYWPENPGVEFFKASFGARVVSRPAVGRMNPVLREYLRRRSPANLVRLGGAALTTAPTGNQLDD